MGDSITSAPPESSSFIEDVTEYFRDTVSRKDLHLLLTDDEAWEGFVAEADLSRDEADALREALKDLATDTIMVDKDRLQKDLRERETLLNKFFQVKLELEERIGKLHALADKIDKVHRDCTISEVVASSTGIASGILTILGLTLAPVTAGVSLGLSATGLGLGAAAAVTSVSTHIVEQSNTLLAKGQASSLLSTKVNMAEVGKEAVNENTPKVISLTKNCSKVLKDIGKNIRAIKVAKASPHLLADAKCLMTTGKISAQGAEQVQKAFAGTALAMTKGARIVGAVTTGVGLLMDLVSLVQNSQHLHEGAKAESAAELRQQAQVLEKQLEELTRCYESLQQGRTQ
ncbi:PREDICTED: apolipoprotein L2-like [Propithecus coquereli]|uniref:apolipoprotein L2-like n=1 Tax=Propithecus coquereli TaxID=379532 RepID=UPI00063EF161|nr:PREDICTED: apolipoprotein L2-like [Propithecus coquereli]